jgi:hypothetical protein
LTADNAYKKARRDTGPVSLQVSDRFGPFVKFGEEFLASDADFAAHPFLARLEKEVIVQAYITNGFIYT